MPRTFNPTVLRRLLMLGAAVLAACAGGPEAATNASNELALFSSAGQAQAYMASDEDQTLYLWAGKPVAYLKEDSAGGYHIYGFNGQHLGWFVDGFVRDHQGNKACATASALGAQGLEPYKGYKLYKPVKIGARSAPSRPLFTAGFSAIPCQMVLGSGAY